MTGRWLADLDDAIEQTETCYDTLLSKWNFSLFDAATLPLPSCPAECKQLVTLAETSECALVEALEIESDVYDTLKTVCNYTDSCSAFVETAIQ